MRYWPVYGGGETITVTLANEFVCRGHNVFIAYMYDKFCDLMPYQLNKQIHSKKLYTIEHYRNKDVEELHRYIVENDIDIMINQWGNTSLCFEAKKNTHCKLITCWHLDVLRKAPKELSGKAKYLRLLLGNNLYEQYNLRKQLKIHKLNYKFSDRYIFLSPFFVNEYAIYSGINDTQKKISAIANPLTYHYRYNINNYSKKKRNVLFVGRILEYHKRLSYILKIWKNVENNSNFNDWSLTVVGDGPDIETVKNLADSLLLRRVFFEGFKDPRSYYEESSVFMMTSAFEGFGMTLLEAQQYATVPMAMDTYGSLHDIIVNGENGIIEPDNALDKYTEDLFRLMNDYNYRKQLAINGLESSQKFSVQKISDKWILCFNQLVKK